MNQLGIESLPTFLVYKNGKRTMRLEGVIEKSLLEKQLQ
jgi:thioredoxin-like negative regulator of GroEL